jgi:anaerobic dimethyl sulfoxide reductase subunit B (iron-sulfur subunit)
MQIGFYFDQTKCTGCFTCIVACKDWNDVPAGPASWRRVTTIGKGIYPDLFTAYLTTSCYHCSKPDCIKACPAGAIRKREEDGVVVVDSEICLGRDSCGMCYDACLYNAPQFGTEENARMQKCDFCLDRLEDGKQPVCVESCPMRALDAGLLDDLREKYGDIRDAEGFTFFSECNPSIIFRPRKDNKQRPVKKIITVP